MSDITEQIRKRIDVNAASCECQADTLLKLAEVEALERIAAALEKLCACAVDREIQIAEDDYETVTCLSIYVN